MRNFGSPRDYGSSYRSGCTYLLPTCARAAARIRFEYVILVRTSTTAAEKNVVSIIERGRGNQRGGRHCRVSAFRALQRHWEQVDQIPARGLEGDHSVRSKPVPVHLRRRLAV
jgi:hypothetical protein